MQNAYDEKTGEATLTQRNKMCVGDEIELVTPGSVGRELTVTPLLDENREPIEATSHPYMKFYMQMPFAVKAGDMLRAR